MGESCRRPACRQCDREQRFGERKILVTGGDRLRRARVVHELRAQGRDVRALVRDPRGRRRLANWGVELATRRRHRRRRASPRPGGLHARRPPRRDHPRQRPADFQRVMAEGPRNVIAAARERRRRALRADERARHQRGDEGARAVLAREVADGAGRRRVGLEHVIFRPSFVFGKGGGILPTFVRQVRYSPVVTVLGPGTAASAADLGRRRRCPLRAGALPRRGARTASSSSAARTRQLERAVPPHRRPARQAPRARPRPVRGGAGRRQADAVGAARAADAPTR